MVLHQKCGFSGARPHPWARDAVRWPFSPIDFSICLISHDSASSRVWAFALQLGHMGNQVGMGIWQSELGETWNPWWRSIIAPCFVSVNKIPSSTGSKMRQWLELHGHSMMNSKSPSLKPNPWPHGNVVWMRSVLSGRWCLKIKGIPLEELARYAKILVYLSPL